MGPPLSDFPALPFLEKVMKDLENLYIGFFKNLAAQISKGTPIVFLLPYWKRRGAPGSAQKISLSDRLVTKIEALGYSKAVFTPLKVTSLFYERPDQVVGREIVKFVKK